MNTIKDFLEANAKEDMRIKFSEERECHIQVAQDDGEPKEKGWTNGRDDWFNLRINRSGPRTFSPGYFQHIESIGLSGWNFVKGISEWVGFDFDSIVGHNKGLPESEIQDLIDRAKRIEWLEVRRSTSGKGVHFYVPIVNSPNIPSRKEHIALAKAILSNLSGLLSFDFRAKVDTCGTILWIWSRKGDQPESFQLIKPASTSFDCNTLPPPNEELSNNVSSVLANLKLEKLEPDHQALLTFLSSRPGRWWWNAELNLLITHTHSFTLAKAALKVRGIYFTNSTGKDYPNDQNCFAFPLKGGSWIIRRYNPGAQEHPSWQTDKNGWTYCHFNRIPSLAEACLMVGGQQDAKGWWVLSGGKEVKEVLSYLVPAAAKDKVKIDETMQYRQFKLRPIRNGKIVIACDKAAGDLLVGWVAQKNSWEKVVEIVEEEKEITTPDSEIRHTVTDSGDAGWYLFSNRWNQEPKTNIASALLALGYSVKQVGEVLGQCVLKPWHLVVKPFQPEYPGNREWNKYAPQLMFDPKPGPFPTWINILENCGKHLTPAVLKNSWCIAHRVITGAEYLKLWIASLFQYSTEPLPYLFFYGLQNAGKSTLHEVLALLISDRGIIKANNAVKSPQQFNGEMLGRVLCVLEEINLTELKHAYDRIKDWVTAKTISIHIKGETPYDLPNTSHWIHCANNPNYCPVAIGDTRIVFIRVERPEIEIPKIELMRRAKLEGAAFLHHLLSLEIPPPVDRLRVPAIETQEKLDEQQASANPIEQFILAETIYCPGHLIPLADFISRAHLWLERQGLRAIDWPALKIGRSLPLADKMPIKGRRGQTTFVANVSFDKEAKPKMFYWVKSEDKLVESFPDQEEEKNP